MNRPKVSRCGCCGADLRQRVLPERSGPVDGGLGMPLPHANTGGGERIAQGSLRDRWAVALRSPLWWAIVATAVLLGGWVLRG